ncbi:MAG TPA: hypothetical protein VHP37_13405 [Burkholderiales bacterium]|nr:hypothetical protein [Burkholderiales bacterium]
MFAKKLAATAVGLCLTWGSAYAGPEMVQDAQPQAGAPADVPPNVGGTNDVIILELGPSPDGTPPGPEEMAAMQMLLLQLLMMQSEMAPSAGGEMQMTAPRAPGLTGI